MRVFVFILVAANLVFFAWTQGYLGERGSPDAIRLQQQLEAERLRVLSRDAPPVAAAAAAKAPEKKAEKAAPVEKCLAWTGLADADAGALDALLADKFSNLRRERHVLPEISTWWVFIPPLANKAEADRKSGELKRMGAPEFFVVQEAGPYRWAISLGIFSSEQAAGERLDALREKGVKSARVARRSTTRPEQVSFELTGPEPLVDAARDAVAAQLPEVKTAACGKR